MAMSDDRNRASSTDNHDHGSGPVPADTLAQVFERLQRVGQRLTPQRMAIVEHLVQSADHVTADDIHTLARERYPYLNLSTVYRTLEMLRDSGIVSETDLGDGRRQFALLSEDLHHHAICLACGGVINIDDWFFEGIRAQLRTEHGFEARIDHIAIFGVCRECAGAAEQDQAW